MGCVSTMVIGSILLHAKFGRNDNRIDAPHLIISKMCCVHSLERIFNASYFGEHFVRLEPFFCLSLIKGSPEGSSDQEFRSSILCDVIENSWWLISRSIENLLKMTSLNFRVDPPVSACLRDWIQKWNGFPSELSLTVRSGSSSVLDSLIQVIPF